MREFELVVKLNDRQKAVLEDIDYKVGVYQLEKEHDKRTINGLMKREIIGKGGSMYFINPVHLFKSTLKSIDNKRIRISLHTQFNDISTISSKYKLRNKLLYVDDSYQISFNINEVIKTRLIGTEQNPDLEIIYKDGATILIEFNY